MLRGVERPATVRAGDLGDLTARWEDQDIAATFREALAEHLDAQATYRSITAEECHRDRVACEALSCLAVELH